MCDKCGHLARRIRSALLPVAGVLVALLVGSLALATEYQKGPAITKPSITSPIANRVWLAGSDHTVTCSASTDTDYERDNPEAQWSPFNEQPITYTWTGTNRNFPRGNVGQSVTYVCSNTAGTATLTVTASAVPVDPSLTKSPVASDPVNVSVIIPVVDQISYAGAKNTINGVTSPEYDRSSGTNQPVSYTVGANPEADVKVWASTNLTDGSSVVMSGTSSGDFLRTQWGNASATFGTDWSSTASVTALCIPTIKSATYSTTWIYCCPTGSNTFINMSTISGSRIYLTRQASLSWTARSGVAYAETEAAYALSCKYCTGMNAATTDANVCDNVMTGFSGDYVYNNLDCAYMAADYTHLIGVQGTSGIQEKWSVKDDTLLTYSDSECMSMTPGTAATNPEPDWPFHWWVTAGGKTRDPCNSNPSNRSFNGDWGAYEDVVIAQYEIWDDTVHYGRWIKNPPGHTFETGAGKMLHDNPGYLVSAFKGPPTPMP
jgi:hypothetical protein